MDERLKGMIANQGVPGPQPWPVSVVQKRGDVHHYSHSSDEFALGTVAFTPNFCQSIWHPANSPKVVRAQSFTMSYASGSAGRFHLLVRQGTKAILGSLALNPSLLDAGAPPPTAQIYFPSSDNATLGILHSTFPGTGSGVFTYDFTLGGAREGIVMPIGVDSSLIIYLAPTATITTTPQITTTLTWSEADY